MLDTNSYQSLPLIIISIITVGVAYAMYHSYKEHHLLNRLITVETEREQEGLPNEVTLTPEDFRLNPELVEMFGITDVDNNLGFDLQTNEHLEYLEAHELNNNIESIFDAIAEILF
jgi:hypothetical protein